MENIFQYSSSIIISDLICGAAVIVPDGKILDAAGRLVQGLGLAPETLPRTINPDVESLHSK